jgi:hypothetical protein
MTAPCGPGPSDTLAAHRDYMNTWRTKAGSVPRCAMAPVVDAERHGTGEAGPIPAVPGRAGRFGGPGAPLARAPSPPESARKYAGHRGNARRCAAVLRAPGTLGIPRTRPKRAGHRGRQGHWGYREPARNGLGIAGSRDTEDTANPPETGWASRAPGPLAGSWQTPARSRGGSHSRPPPPRLRFLRLQPATVW